MEKQYDVVIIGAGIAGAMLAYQLSKQAGISILLLEAGADRTAERIDMSLKYAGTFNKSPRSPYQNAPGYLTSPDSAGDYEGDPKFGFKSTYLKLGGGTTWHFLGNVPRFVVNDFQLNSTYRVGVDWPLSYKELEPFYSLAEEEIGVSGSHEEWNNLYGAFRSKEYPMPKIWTSYSDTVIQPKLDDKEFEGFKIKVRGTPQARNSHPYNGRPACAGNSSCVPICPIGAKYDATVHIKKAIEQKVEVCYKSIVFKLEKDADGKITKAWFRNWEKQESFVEAKIFVVAAHAIESALLLQVSGLANSSGMLGKNLMDHAQGAGVCLSNEPLFPYRGPPTTSGIDVFRDGAFRSTHAAFRMSLGNDGWGSRWKGDDNIEKLLTDNMTDNNFIIGKKLFAGIEQKITHSFRFSYSTEVLPSQSNWVVPGTKIDEMTGMPIAKVNFSIDEYNKKAFEFAWKAMDFMFTEIGSSFKEVPINRDDFSGAGHIMGTTKMGFDEKTAVVNKDCRCFDHSNLYLTGPGVFPTSGTANPTLTAAALTLRLAEKIKDELPAY